MARRRSSKDDVNIVAVCLNAPWQISAVLAVVAFGVMRWVVPSQFTAPAVVALGKASSGLAPVVSGLILLIAAASYFRSKATPSSPTYPEDPTFERADPSSAPEIDFSRFSGKPNREAVLPNEWSIELLRKLEWHRFETLCAEYFRLLGKRVETITHGADGGVDARIYAQDSQTLEYAVQCKAWNNLVGVKPVRELFGVMAHESAGKGIFMTTNSFSDDATQFAAEHNDKVFLVDGQRFIKMIGMLSEEKRAQLLAFATEGDYTTPTCASCGVKMIWRPKGDFWGCQNFPRCRSTLKVAKAYAHSLVNSSGLSSLQERHTDNKAFADHLSIDYENSPTETQYQPRTRSFKKETFIMNGVRQGFLKIVVVGIVGLAAWLMISYMFINMQKKIMEHTQQSQQRMAAQQAETLRQAQAAANLRKQQEVALVQQPRYEQVLVRGKSARECARPDGALDNYTVKCMSDHYEIVDTHQ